MFSLQFFILFSVAIFFICRYIEFCWQIKVTRQTNYMDGWMDLEDYRYVWTEKGKRRMSAVCQRFWWVDGKADTALGIRGQPSAYPSITLFPSISLCYPSIPCHMEFLMPRAEREGRQWRRRDGALLGSFQTHWTQCFHLSLWLLYV